MSNGIIEFKDDAGMPVKFTSQDIRERLCPNATESELALCVELCNRQHLNPFTKEVYLVKYGSARRASSRAIRCSTAAPTVRRATAASRAASW